MITLIQMLYLISIIIIHFKTILLNTRYKHNRETHVKIYIATNNTKVTY